MSDEAPGVGQEALPPREGQVGLRTVTDRPSASGTTMRLTQVVGGQYVITSQPHGLPSLTQLSPSSLSGTTGSMGAHAGQPGVTRIISISPSRGQSTSPLRPSVANQSIVNVLTSKSRPGSNVRLQLFPSSGDGQMGPATGTSLSPRTLKRPPSSSGEKKDNYASKLQRVMNHRIVRSKLVKEKYNEHLLEAYYLETGSNILDLYQFAKKPKTQAYLAYLRDHAIDPKEYHQQETPMETSSTAGVTVPMTTPSTPSATAASSLPGISHSTSSYTSTPTVSTISSASTDSMKASAVAKAKSQLNITPSASPTPGGTTPTSTAATNQELIVEKAKQEAYVVQRISDLQKEGLWSERRLPKIQEMPRNKAHWDFLLEEMHWLAADFAQERKWKKAAAKKCARMVQKYFQDKAVAAQRAEKAQEQHLRRMAAFCAREIKIFWSNVEKLVEYKQNTILEEKRKKALDQQLSFIVDQTEKYSQLLAEGMNKQPTVQSSDQQKDQTTTASNMSSRCPSRVPSDIEFEPDEHSDEEDDEETIAQEEAMVDKEGRDAEVEALQKESQMELDDLLEDDLLRNYLMNRDSIRLSESEDDDDDDDEKRSGSKSKEEEDEKEESDSSREEEEDEASEDENEEKEEEETQTSQEGEDELKMLLAEDSHIEGEITKTDKKDDLINDAAAIAESIQPKGNTLSSTNVSTKIPFLLKYSLREYQHIGLDWLVTMYERKLNGILADEMGLGKTIQTIALLAHLACEKENWGPHLIVVPTSVMLNWEMECKKWCPAFKILTYYGSQKERKLKRTGWTKPNAFHICITSYKLVIQDHQSFRRKKWKYLILDEAQNIKNFKSQRWQLLLNFQTQQRLLLTGTPLQNNLMELWSLMHFLMPNVFQSHREFKEWFSNPVTGMIEGNSEYNENIIKRLHKVLRPFLLRRLKSEVEKQMPKKYEHVVMCRLSKRQRFLYDDYMSRAKTKETLATGNLLSVINVLMQLRKVCNHPNLFEVRPTISPFQCEEIEYHIPSIVYSALDYDPWKHVDLYALNLLLIMHELRLSSYQCYRMRQSRSVSRKIVELGDFPTDAAPESDRPPPCPPNRLSMRVRAAAEVKQEKRDASTTGGGQQHQQGKGGVTTPGQQQKVKLSNVQLINQPGFVKAIPVVNISQAGQVSGQGNNATVLKPTTNFAQIVQSATGKHLVLTSNPGITTNIPITYTTSVQTLKFLSKQPVTTVGNAGHGVTKAFVKFQLSSVTTVNTTPITTTNSVQCTVKSEDKNSLGGVRPSVGNDYIGRLYSKQNNLDVRWKDRRSSRSQGVVKDATRDLTGDKDDPKGERTRRLQLMATVNARRCDALPLYGRDFQDVVKIFKPNEMDVWSGGYVRCLNTLYGMHMEEQTDCLRDMLYNPERRIEQLKDVCDRFIFFVPAVKAPEPEMRVWHPSPSKYWGQKEQKQLIRTLFSKMATPLHPIASAMVTQFPDPRLIQYDCGKLQTLDRLLRRLKAETHRVLIFTQMTKMLDVLEAFLNYHGHIYLRLDGTTKVDQRQVLMERFNNDKRIFAFILSTRSGGVGVNLTGADTVIFYDSDWNPTMDAQAQDRCHRIGQTRDVHIYRLVSERTIEENILKKANQKRLLGDLAIEGGNFTTAYFKSSTIQDLFNVDQSEDTTATSRLAELVDAKKDEQEKPPQLPVAANTPPAADEKTAVGALESALAACEDDQDVQAARTAKAEAVADLAEFDEDIPLEEQQQEPAQQQQKEISKAEQEINSVIEKLSPIEKYAMKFIEATESAWSAEQLAAAEREIEEQKREWEKNRLAAMREEEERRARELEEEADIITYSREDAANQIWVSDSTMEQMPMWCPPTPPTQEGDMYVDQTMSFLYDVNVMSESQLPPIYVKRSSGECKRNRAEAGLSIDGRRPAKMPRKEEAVQGAGGIPNVPRSLFHSPAVLKMRRDLKLQKYRGLVRPSLPIPGKAAVQKPPAEQPVFHEWTIHEDMAILKVIQNFQGLPLNLLVMNPGHTPNWDFVADYVNTVSVTYRTPKQCKYRYEMVLMQREEGKQICIDPAFKKKKNKIGGSVQKFALGTKASSRGMRTSQMYTQDNNVTFSQMMNERFETLKSIVNKRVPTARAAAPSSPVVTKRPTQAQVQAAAVAAAQQQQQQQQQAQPPTPQQEGLGIDLEHPVLPVEVAARRAERLAREKKGAEQQIAARLQMIKAGLIATSSQSSSSAGATSSTAATPAVASIASSVQQVISTQVATVATTAISTSTTPGTPPNTLRTQRLIASPIQTSTVVSVASLSAAHLQAATQRLIVSGGTAGQGKTVVATAQGIQGKQAQLAMIRQANLNKQLRLHHHGNIAAAAAAAAAAQGGGQAGAGGGPAQVKTSTVTIGGQQAVVQFTQAQQQQQANARAQFIRQGTVTVGGKGGITRTVTENEVAQLLKKQHQLQQKLAGAGGAGTIQNLSPQVLAQAIQAGSSGTPVATLVKTVSTAGVTQTMTLPVTNVTLAAAQGKSLTPAALKAAAAAGATSPQLRQLQIQQQLLAQKKLAAAAAAASGAAGTSGAGGTSGATTAQKLSIAQVQAGKSAVQAQAAQLIVGSKPIGQPMTVQQFQQVMRSPLNVQQGPVVLAKGPPRVIPVNTAQGTKQTIQVVAATSQALSSALRPQNVSSLAGALSGTKVQSASTQQALLSALGQNVGVRLGSPVRLQTTSGTPIVAVSVQNVQQQGVSSQTTNQNEQE